MRVHFRDLSAGESIALLRRNHVGRSVFDGRSVVVHGALYLLDPEHPPRDPAARRRAIRLLRRITPETLSAADPVAFRDVLFRVFADEVNGRAAKSE